MTDRVQLIHDDCRNAVRNLPDNSIDSCVTDPPYALVSIQKRFGKPGSAPAQEGRDGLYRRASSGFMGQQWDTGETAFDPDFWREVYRVLKPGAHLLAFSGTRTYHRMACAIEDAGFEIRDMVSWLYGSGFPKSHDVSKGIQKRRTEDSGPIRAVCRSVRAAMDAKGLKSHHLISHFGDCHPRLIDHWAARDTDSQPSLPTWEQWLVLKSVLSIGDEQDHEVWRLNGRKGMPGDAWSEAKIIGTVDSVAPGLVGMRFGGDNTIRETTDEATQWQGWGTALKPALEPICLARKPLDGTVAANVLAHGTGALNIGGCRIGPDGHAGIRDGRSDHLGRWPANVVHDGSDEVLAAFPETNSGALTAAQQVNGGFAGTVNCYGKAASGGTNEYSANAGSAARFFYSAKADANDRLGSKHPTVKPVDLIQYLVRLVTPKDGLVLDPFAGTGTTGEACFREGVRAILIEREPQFAADIQRRISLFLSGPDERARAIVKAKGLTASAGPLFGDEAA